MVANQNLPPTCLFHIFMLDLLSFADASGKLHHEMDMGDMADKQREFSREQDSFKNAVFLASVHQTYKSENV